ncbi:hypothetical protein N4R57_17175 [Rhodobacteraceae bacterium D3-12]|nr:hypothetical protein N4R57_17175 [Rhodobacteraceae bacterium D3-12]
MRRRRFFMSAVSAAMLLPQGVSAQSESGLAAGNITGFYKAEGRNPDGSRYSGQVSVQEQPGGGVGFAWTVGNQSYTGIGRREGRVVTVNWGSDAPVVYVVMPDGSLHGTWSNGRALERLVK